MRKASVKGMLITEEAAYRIGQGPTLCDRPRVGIGKQHFEQLLDRVGQVSSSWSESRGGRDDNRFGDGDLGATKRVRDAEIKE
jgi:hypothetical protein